jgi:type IV pilus assembly protein PilX
MNRIPANISQQPAFMHKQQGAVLVTGLLILLILTIIGITGMSNTTMQERMASNDRDRQVAFQAAEAALRHAEKYLGSPGTSLSSSSFDDDCESPLAGHCNPKPASTEQWLISANWTDSDKHIPYSTTGETLSSPKYIIEYMGKQVIPPATLPCPTCNDIFRITALASGATNTARVMLQSYYVTTP